MKPPEISAENFDICHLYPLFPQITLSLNMHAMNRKSSGNITLSNELMSAM
jgi:hypothetical protein